MLRRGKRTVHSGWRDGLAIFRPSRQADPLIEVQIPSQPYRDTGLREDELLVLSPRKARVFVDAGEGI